MALGSHRLHRRQDLLHEVDGRAGEVHARLARLLLGAGRHDDHVGATADLDVVRSVDLGLGDEHRPVPEVEHLGPHLGGVDVGEHDPSGRSAHEHRVGRGGPDRPGADHGHLESLSAHAASLLPRCGVRPGVKARREAIQEFWGKPRLMPA